MAWKRSTIAAAAAGLAAASLLLAAAPHSARAFHDWRDQIRCLDCHVTLPLQVGKLKDLGFYATIDQICRSCHPGAHGTAKRREFRSHPLVAKTDLSFPRDMPKDTAGRMNCMTCHYYHPSNTSPDNTSLLRRPADRNFCLYCHKTLPQARR